MILFAGDRKGPNNYNWMRHLRNFLHFKLIKINQLEGTLKLRILMSIYLINLFIYLFILVKNEAFCFSKLKVFPLGETAPSGVRVW